MKRFIFFGIFIAIGCTNLFGQWNYNRFFPYFVGGSAGTVGINAHDNAYVSSNWGAYSYTRIDYHPFGIGDRKTYYLFKIDEILDTVHFIQKIDNYEVKSNILFPLQSNNILFSIRNSGSYAYISKITADGELTSIGTYSNGTITSFDAIDQNHLYFLFQSTEIEMNRSIFITQIDNQIQNRDTFYTQTPKLINIPTYNVAYMSVIENVTGEFQILKSMHPFSQWDLVFNALYTAIKDIHFLDQQLGYAILAPGTIIKTTDGGVNWDTVYCNVNQTLNKINPISDNIVYACGNNGVIIKSMNGGLNWNNEQTNTTEHLTKIFMFNPYRGYSTSWSDCFKMDAPLYTDSTESKEWIFGPNPNYGIINIVSDVVVQTVEIISLDGKLLFSQEFDTRDFNFSYFPHQSGIYLLKLTYKDGTVSTGKIFFNKGE